MENQDYDKLYGKMQDDIKALQNEFQAVSGDVGSLNDSHSAVRSNMETINGSLENLNKSIAEMRDKLDALAEEQQRNAVDSMLHKKGGGVSAMIVKPLRRLAVGSVSALMLFGGYTAEKLSLAREELEDIVAEASYNNKQRGQNKKAGQR